MSVKRFMRLRAIVWAAFWNDASDFLFFTPTCETWLFSFPIAFSLVLERSDQVRIGIRAETISEAWYVDGSWTSQHKQRSRKGRRISNRFTSASVWRDNQSVLTRWFYGSPHPLPHPSSTKHTHIYPLSLCWRLGHGGAILDSLRLTGSHGARVDTYGCGGFDRRCVAVKSRCGDRSECWGRGKRRGARSASGKDGWMRLNRNGVCGAAEHHCWLVWSVSLRQASSSSLEHYAL